MKKYLVGLCVSALFCSQALAGQHGVGAFGVQRSASGSSSGSSGGAANAILNQSSLQSGATAFPSQVNVGGAAAAASGGILNVQSNAQPSGVFTLANVQWLGARQDGTTIIIPGFFLATDTGTVQTTSGHNPTLLGISSVGVNGTALAIGSEGKTYQSGFGNSYGNMGFAMTFTQLNASNTTVGFYSRVYIATKESSLAGVATGTAINYYAEPIVGGAPDQKFVFYSTDTASKFFTVAPILIGTTTWGAELYVSSAGAPNTPMVLVATSSSKIFEIMAASATLNVPTFIGSGTITDLTASSLKIGAGNIGQLIVNGTTFYFTPSSFTTTANVAFTSGTFATITTTGMAISSSVVTQEVDFADGTRQTTAGGASGFANPATTGLNMNGFGITNSSGVSIGTNVPVALVHISTNNGYAKPLLVISTGNTTLCEVTGTSMTINVTSNVVIPNSWVGMGTKNPINNLHIRDNQANTGIGLTIENAVAVGNGGKETINFKDGAGNQVGFLRYFDSNGAGSVGPTQLESTNKDLQLTVGGTPEVYIKNTGGNVGINTTNPSSQLYVNGGSITVAGTNMGVEIGTAPVFNSTAVAINLTGYTMEFGTATVGAGQTITINTQGANLMFPQITEYNNTGLTSNAIEIGTWNVGANTFTLKNQDASNARNCIWSVLKK